MPTTPKDSFRTVTFAYRATDAPAVYLSGTFNGWSSHATPMQTDAEGDWSVSLRLRPGRYQYKLVVDGEWCARAADASDSERVACVPNEFGTENVVLEVS